ncbi:elongation factor P [Thermoflexus sp.]|nr:elongation factor P [Thermoflexus sp.]MCS6963450.1 elongation factor P [Thermoflexus sp.]MCX7689938.1 elongation factor P [Thermoflexus sp.]MDW8184175.1 elongation factor P [Anaerolineae bacterium]
MPAASELRPGMAIRLEGTLFLVIDAVYHSGTAQQKGVVHTRLRNLRTGVVTDRRFRPEERVEEVSLERRVMEYLYNDGEMFYFMDPETYDQIPIPAAMIGDLEIFLQPNQRIPVEFHEGQPVAVAFPETVDLRVVHTSPPLRERESHVYKPAILENGIEVLVPQFITEGDIVRINVYTRAYVDRVGKRVS